MATVLCVLYGDPADGYPHAYARDGIPKIDSYYDGSSTPTPEAIDFTPGELLGSVSGELGLRSFLEERGHQLTVTSDKDGPDSVFERELAEALRVGCAEIGELLYQVLRRVGLRAHLAIDHPARLAREFQRALEVHRTFETRHFADGLRA